ncbi:MAG: metallophosphoesterase [Clostridia bacterium]|nr:metallophosphoesterase [Clostridia bacterium]
MTNFTNENKVKFKNGRLRIIHITDTHLSDDNIDMSLVLIEQACLREKPDIAVITGDNVQNYDDSSKTKKYIDRLMSIFDDQKIPVAVTFGNHDSETGAMSREELMAHYNTHPSSVSIDDGEELSGCGTYIVPVMSSDNSRIAFNLWIFDSGDYDEKGRYGCVLPDQVEWYKRVSDELTAANNGQKVYSLAFQHMIVRDVYDALIKTDKRKLYSFPHMYNKDEYYLFNPEMKNFGTLNETPCSGYYNYGQFEAMVEKGDVLGIFTGHDHTNAFGVRYKGIDIVNSLSTRFQNDRFSSQYGYRILDVNENDTSRYESRVGRWYNMFTFKEIRSYKDKLLHKTAFAVTVKGLCQRFLTSTGRKFCSLVTGRQNTYPH